MGSKRAIGWACGPQTASTGTTGLPKGATLSHHSILDEASLTAFCKGQIATFKIPKYWKFTDEFPMTVTGKVQKYKMRELSTQQRKGPERGRLTERGHSLREPRIPGPKPLGFREKDALQRTRYAQAYYFVRA